MIFKLTYLRDYIFEEDDVPKNVWWDEELKTYCIHDDADNIRDVFSYQFQIGRCVRKGRQWFAQVEYGSPNERVIIQRRNQKKLVHVILQHCVFENDEAEQFWTFERVRSKDFYKSPPAAAPPAPAEAEIASAVKALSVSGDEAADSAAAAASRS